MIRIENGQFKILLGHIRLAFGSPDNKAAWAQGRQALTTLEDYLTAAEAEPTLDDSEDCDECGQAIPNNTGGSLANKWHRDTCSLYDPKEG